MDKLKIVAALIVAALGLLSQVFALTGYVPPLAIDKLLHVTPEQITAFAGLALAFLAPIHTLALQAWALVVDVFKRDNPGADAAYLALLDEVSKMRAELAKQRLMPPVPISEIPPTAAPAAPVASVPSAQAGRMRFGGMVMTAVLALAGLLGVMAFGGCSTAQQNRVDADLQRVQIVLSQACPTLQASVVTLGVLDLSPDGAAALSVAKQAIDGACAVGAGATLANVQALANAALPQLDNAVKASSLSDAEKEKVVVDLGVANALINTFLNAAKPPAMPASAPASAALTV